MAEWLDDEVETYVGAILAVFKALGKKIGTGQLCKFF